MLKQFQDWLLAEIKKIKNALSLAVLIYLYRYTVILLLNLDQQAGQEAAQSAGLNLSTCVMNTNLCK